jgi:hypothetical protein
LFSAFDSREDTFGIGGPDEWLWICVGVGDEAIDSSLKVIEGSEDAALEALGG